MGMGLGFVMLGAGHPLVAHLVSPGAVEPAGGLLSFCLGGIHRRYSSRVGVLGRGDSRPAGGAECDQDQPLHGLSECRVTL